jgi:hypothetical protein
MNLEKIQCNQKLWGEQHIYELKASQFPDYESAVALI